MYIDLVKVSPKWLIVIANEFLLVHGMKFCLHHSTNKSIWKYSTSSLLFNTPRYQIVFQKETPAVKRVCISSICAKVIHLNYCIFRWIWEWARYLWSDLRKKTSSVITLLSHFYIDLHFNYSGPALHSRDLHTFQPFAKCILILHFRTNFY